MRLVFMSAVVLAAMLSYASSGQAASCASGGAAANPWMGVVAYDDGSSAVGKHACFPSEFACWKWVANSLSLPKGRIKAVYCRDMPVGSMARVPQWMNMMNMPM